MLVAVKEGARTRDHDDAEEGDETADTLGAGEGLVQEEGTGEAGGYGGEKGYDRCFGDGEVEKGVCGLR